MDLPAAAGRTGGDQTELSECLQLFLQLQRAGDPGLFTLKGREVLQNADVVVLDDFVPEGVRAMIPSDARIVDRREAKAGRKRHLQMPAIQTGISIKNDGCLPVRGIRVRRMRILTSSLPVEKH